MKKEWKKEWKKVLAFVLTLVLALSAGVVMPQGTDTVQAAEKVYINPYSDKVVTYKPGDGISEYHAVISIMGCNKKSEIKNLKSSNKDIRVEAKEGYIVGIYGDKAGTATITCTVKGVKLKTTLTVKKYTNPLKSFKIGNKNYTAKYKNNNVYYQSSNIKNQKLSIEVKSGWKITLLEIYNGERGTSITYPKSRKVNKKISLNSDYSYVAMSIENAKTGVLETIFFYKTDY